MDEVTQYRFDVALSYASEQRPYVEEVKNGLADNGIRVYYDKDQQAASWGARLIEYFQRVFEKEAKYCMVFVSRNYAERAWPNHELRAAMARQIRSQGKYILPVRFDDTELPGLDPTIGYVRAQEHGPERIVDFFLDMLFEESERWAESGSMPPESDAAVESE